MIVTVSPTRRRACVALAAAVFGSACAAPTDATPVEAASASASLVRSTASSTPGIFAPDAISDDNEQWRITFTPDGKTAYFAESPEFFPFTRQATIYVSTFVDGAWTEPVVAPFSGQYSDIDPFISPNGQRLYFSSIRPVDGVMRGDIDLWMVERTATGWSEPFHLGPEVNSPADELYRQIGVVGIRRGVVARGRRRLVRTLPCGLVAVELERVSEIGRLLAGVHIADRYGRGRERNSYSHRLPLRTVCIEQLVLIASH